MPQTMSVPRQGSVVARQGSQGSSRVRGAHQPLPQPHRRLELPWVRAWPHTASRAGANRAPVSRKPPQDFSPWLEMGQKEIVARRVCQKCYFFYFEGNFRMNIPHFQLSCEFFPLPPVRAGKRLSAISTGKEISSPLSLAFSRKEKKLKIKLEEGEAH